jgi:hypothetical protein
MNIVNITLRISRAASTNIVLEEAKNPIVF